MADSIPHDWLFPQVAMVVHHGGAGTTAAGLRAGKPSTICPFMADQPFWRRLIHHQGVGPELIPQFNLNADRRAEAIQTAVNDSAMQQRAAEMGAKIRAVEIIGEVIHDSVNIYR
jgi:sterol 3beta-glucosyltransferase